VTLLDPALLGRLERLQLATRRPLAGHLAGEHRSPRYGSSLDFADYREYVPGDDFRRIDYQLLARLDIVVLKLFEAEDELNVRLLIDTSASMAQGDKLRQAARLAGALGFVALVRRDTVSLQTFPQPTRAPRFTGRQAAGALFDQLERLEADGPSNVVEAALASLSRPGPPGLIVLFSDLLTPQWEAGISRLPARGGDLVVVHVLSPDELDPPLFGDIEVVDRETRERVAVSLSAETLAEFRDEAADWLDRVALRCRQVGAGYVRVLSDDDIEPLLLGGWRAEGVLR
jgi:uncharacterized protein (DUF58 family)